MGYQAERDSFVHAMARLDVSLWAITRLLKWANVVQRYAVHACNRELTASEMRAENRATARIIELVQGLNAHTPEGKAWGVVVTDDPRGYVVTVWSPIGQDFGVPTRRF